MDDRALTPPSNSGTPESGVSAGAWRPSSEPLIITCALTGGIHGKEANPHLPEQPDEIVEQGIAAWRAGAAVLHVHARTPTGATRWIAASTRSSTGGCAPRPTRSCSSRPAASPRLAVEQRLTTVLLAPEMCSLNMGLLNFFIHGEQVFFSNHRSDIERFAREIRARGVQPELEVYSAVMLEEAASAARAGDPRAALRDQLRAQHADPGRARGTPRNLLDMWERLDELGVPRSALRVTVSAMGRRSCRSRRWRCAMGLNVRVGMEDNVFYRRGELLDQQRTARRAHGADRA